MELFSLLAKLTLDTNDFDKGIDQAEKDLKGIDAPDTTLGLDNSEFNQNIEESQGLGDNFGTSMEGVFNGIKTALTTTGIVMAISGIVDQLRQAVSLAAQTADEIDKSSRKLGISTDTYQRWDHALKQSGSSIDVVKKGIQQFQLAVEAADPATPFADAADQVDGLADKYVGLNEDTYTALRDLGLLAGLQAGQFSSAEELMEAALLSLASYEGTVEERGIITRKLFGRNGDELNALLDSGRAGVEALLAEADQLGLVMSPEEIANAVAYGDAMANLHAEIDSIKTAFVQGIIPYLTTAAKWLTEILTNLNPRLQTNSVYQIFNEIDAKTLIANRKVEEATVTAKKLIEDLQNMGNYWTLDEQGRMTWDALAQKAIDLFPQLSDYIEQDGHKIRGNTEDIEKNIDAWARLEKQRLLSTAMAEKEEAVAKQLLEAYEKGAEASVKTDEAQGKKMTALKAMEEFLNSSRGEGYRWNLENNYGYTGQMTEDFFDQYGAGIDIWVKEGGTSAQKNAIDAWKEAESQARSLREESDKMIEDAEKAQSQLDDYERRLSEQMGLTTEGVNTTEEAVQKYIDTLNAVPKNVTTSFRAVYDDFRGHAIGSAYIPYDNYPALLHRGEKVLTSTEARQSDSGGIDYSALEDRITAAIRSGMDGATVRSYLNGKDITAEVNRNMISDIKNRRFAT